MMIERKWTPQTNTLSTCMLLQQQEWLDTTSYPSQLCSTEIYYVYYIEK